MICPLVSTDTNHRYTFKALSCGQIYSKVFRPNIRQKLERKSKLVLLTLVHIIRRSLQNEAGADAGCRQGDIHERGSGGTPAPDRQAEMWISRTV